MGLDADEITAAKEQAFARFRGGEELAGDADGNLEILGERFNIMGADYFMADIYHALTETYGEGAGGILQRTGKGYGNDLADVVDGEGADGFGTFLGLLAFLGYSDPAIEEDRVVFPAAPTAEEYAKKGYDDQRVCYFLAGMLTGAAEHYLGEGRGFVETACRADGDDRCAFTLQRGD